MLVYGIANTSGARDWSSMVFLSGSLYATIVSIARIRFICSISKSCRDVAFLSAKAFFEASTFSFIDSSSVNTFEYPQFPKIELSICVFTLLGENTYPLSCTSFCKIGTEKGRRSLSIS